MDRRRPARAVKWVALGALTCSGGCSLFKSEAPPPWQAAGANRGPAVAQNGLPTSTPPGASPFGAPLAATNPQGPPVPAVAPVQTAGYGVPPGQSPALYHVGLGTPPQATPASMPAYPAPTQPHYPPTGYAPPQQMTGPGGVVIPPPVAPPSVPQVGLPASYPQPPYGTTPGISPALGAPTAGYPQPGYPPTGAYPAPAASLPPTPMPVAGPGVPAMPPAFQAMPRDPYANPSAMPPGPTAGQRPVGAQIAPADYRDLPPAPGAKLPASPLDDFSNAIPPAPVAPSLDNFRPGSR